VTHRDTDASQDHSSYEPPIVEDLDSQRGPVETAAGALPPSSFVDENANFAAPREL
jgi:hypothetical protein